MFLVGTLTSTLTTMKFYGSRTMHEHVIEMTNIAARLKDLGNDSTKGIMHGAGKKFVKKHDKGKGTLKINEHQRVIISISMGNLDISKRIAQGVRFSSKRKRFLTIQNINPNEKFVFIGNRVKALAEAVETYNLILNIGHHLDLLETLYVP
ncbi:hypothetical protein CR513_50455, partial [Mucuna pruriens]